MLSSFAPGARVLHLIGNRQTGQVDRHPARLVQVRPGVDDRNRPGQVADLIVQRTTLAGETYLRAQSTLVSFLWDREEVVPDLDTESIPALLQKVQDAQAAFLASPRPVAQEPF